jgi:hypothetical protein
MNEETECVLDVRRFGFTRSIDRSIGDPPVGKNMSVSLVQSVLDDTADVVADRPAGRACDRSICGRARTVDLRLHYSKRKRNCHQQHDLLNWHPLYVLAALKTDIKLPFFMGIIMLIAWYIWTTINDYIFK